MVDVPSLSSDTAPIDATVPNPDDSSVSQASPPRTEAALPAAPSEPLDLAYHCATLSGLLDSADPSVGWPESQDVSDDCRTALDRRFLDASVSNTILPASSSPSWRQVFGGFPGKVGLVKAALVNENCDVPDGQIRPHLASDCAARAMAEVAVLAGVCGFARAEQWIESGTGLPRGVPRDNIYGHYLSSARVKRSGCTRARLDELDQLWRCLRTGDVRQGPAIAVRDVDACALVDQDLRRVRPVP